MALPHDLVGFVYFALAALTAGFFGALGVKVANRLFR
jgi:hypothetical protein